MLHANERNASSLFGHWPNIKFLLLWVTENSRCQIWFYPLWAWCFIVDMINVNNLWVVWWHRWSSSSATQPSFETNNWSSWVPLKVHWIAQKNCILWNNTHDTHTPETSHSYLINDKQAKIHPMSQNILYPIMFQIIFIDISILIVNNMEIL